MHRNEDRLIEAFEVLRDRLFGSAFLLLGHREDARDAVQDAFLKCWRSRHKLDGRSPDAWIFTVLLNSARDLGRRRKVRRTETLPEEEKMPVANPAPSPLETASRRELVERIRAAIVKLPEREREIFLLRQNGGLTYAAIAEAVGAPLGTVKTRMRSALAKLREVLSGRVR